jgi:hypothetical protein
MLLGRAAGIDNFVEKTGRVSTTLAAAPREYAPAGWYVDCLHAWRAASDPQGLTMAHQAAIGDRSS